MTSIAYGTLAAAWFPFFPFFSAPFLGLVLSVLLSLGLLLHSIGFLGFWRAYSMTMGASAFVLGLVAPLVFLASSIVAFNSCGPPYYCYRALPGLAAILVIVSLILLGVMFIADGAAFLFSRRFARVPGESFAAGVLCIIGGILVASVLLALLGGFFIAGSVLILGSVVLGKTRTTDGGS
ncbi:MAG: hypothetical protein A3K65_07970 [Euryarchaeota archaeon RBG_16_68_12]|nr:MAG: hypothetical protein A3K65_07970 [Euryarchaeota archaeon RBG_16_68_12]